MNLAIYGAKTFSTCAKKQYMAIILDEDGKVLGMGYNGGPAGYPHCVDGGCPRFLEGSASGSSYDNCIACHAETNAIIHSQWGQRKNCSLYVNGPPCYSCAKIICNTGITTVYYLEDSSYIDFADTKELFNQCNVELVEISKKDL